jgi:hypothetical protein
MADKYNTQLDKQIIERYKREVKDGELDLGEVAVWAIQNNLWKEPLEDRVEKLRKQLATAMRSKTFTDPKGRKPRQNYCVRREGVHPDGRKYLQTVWAHIDVATHPFMELAFSQRRSGIAGTCVQGHVDVAHYNEFKRGDNPEIQFPLNFTEDVADLLQSTDYVPGELEGLED